MWANQPLLFRFERFGTCSKFQSRDDAKRLVGTPAPKPSFVSQLLPLFSSLPTSNEAFPDWCCLWTICCNSRSVRTTHISSSVTGTHFLRWECSLGRQFFSHVAIGFIDHHWNELIVEKLLYELKKVIWRYQIESLAWNSQKCKPRRLHGRIVDVSLHPLTSTCNVRFRAALIIVQKNCSIQRHHCLLHFRTQDKCWYPNHLDWKKMMKTESFFFGLTSQESTRHRHKMPCFHTKTAPLP